MVVTNTPVDDLGRKPRHQNGLLHEKYASTYVRSSMEGHKCADDAVIVCTSLFPQTDTKALMQLAITTTVLGAILGTKSAREHASGKWRCTRSTKKKKIRNSQSLLGLHPRSNALLTVRKLPIPPWSPPSFECAVDCPCPERSRQRIRTAKFS
jgi:hypothetical protein